MLTDPSLWLPQAHDWIHAELDRQGIDVNGAIDQPHMRPWSHVLRVPTTTGDVFFKAVAPELCHEVALTAMLARWKQFVVLMPSIFVLIALGLQQIQRSIRGQLGAWIVCAVCLFIFGASLVNVKRMWGITKSPEGLAVQYVQSNLHQGDAIVSLHYSLNAAASFYLNDEPIFTNPLRTGDDTLFSRTPSVLYDLVPIQRSASLKNLGSYARIWVLSHTNQPPPLEQAFMRECTTIQQQDFTPFRVVLLSDCHLGRARP